MPGIDSPLRLLLISNARSSDGTYLKWALPGIRTFLSPKISSVHFIPYAATPGTSEVHAQFARRVRDAFGQIALSVVSVHECERPLEVIRSAQAIVVGGGNTFVLLKRLEDAGLLEVIAERARAGVPYIGWSAGANLTCPTICTTNDMPIVQPRCLNALHLVPFQVNSHYTDAHLPGYRGETRAERIAEFLALHPSATVVGLREGAMLRCEGGRAWVLGAGARVFRAGADTRELAESDEIDA